MQLEKSSPLKLFLDMALRYLKHHAVDLIKQQGYELDDWDIRWVLTVPAIWTAPAKQFMREAAQKVHI